MTRFLEWTVTGLVVVFAAVGAGVLVALFAAATADALERSARRRPTRTGDELDVELELRIERERQAWERHLAGWVPDDRLTYDEQIEEHGRRWRAYLRDAGTLRDELPETRPPNGRHPA